MKKRVLLLIAITFLSGYGMAQDIVSTPIIDARGNFGTSSNILVRGVAEWHPSDMVPPSPNNIVYSEDTFSNGVPPISLDRERSTSIDRFVTPPVDPPITLITDPRVCDVDKESFTMAVLMEEDREDQTREIGDAFTNFNTFRKNRDLTTILF